MNSSTPTLADRIDISSLKEHIKPIYERFKEVRGDILTNTGISPYMEHPFAFMCKAFALFVDYYNMYLYALPKAIENAALDNLNDFPEDDEKAENVSTDDSH